MSSPIVPTHSTTDARSAVPVVPNHTAPVAADPVSALSWSAQLESAVSGQKSSSGPPAEVLDQMASAARTYESLGSRGRALRFVHDDPSGQTAVEVHDRLGNFIKRLSLAEAFDVAAGAPLD